MQGHALSRRGRTRFDCAVPMKNCSNLLSFLHILFGRMKIIQSTRTGSEAPMRKKRQNCDNPAALVRQVPSPHRNSPAAHREKTSGESSVCEPTWRPEPRGQNRRPSSPRRNPVKAATPQTAPFQRRRSLPSIAATSWIDGNSVRFNELKQTEFARPYEPLEHDDLSSNRRRAPNRCIAACANPSPLPLLLDTL